MRTKWEDIPKAHKVVTVISVSVSALVVLFAVMQLFNIWDRSVSVCVPLLGVVNSCQAYLQWKSNRKTAYFCIGTAVFIFICSFVILFVQQISI